MRKQDEKALDLSWRRKIAELINFKDWRNSYSRDSDDLPIWK